MQKFKLIFKQYFQGNNGHFQETEMIIIAENCIQAINIMVEDYPHDISTILDIKCERVN